MVSGATGRVTGQRGTAGTGHGARRLTYRRRSLTAAVPPVPPATPVRDAGRDGVRRNTDVRETVLLNRSGGSYIMAMNEVFASKFRPGDRPAPSRASHWTKDRAGAMFTALAAGFFAFIISFDVFRGVAPDWMYIAMIASGAVVSPIAYRSAPSWLKRLP